MKMEVMRIPVEAVREGSQEVVSSELIHSAWVMDFTRQSKVREDTLNKSLLDNERVLCDGGGCVMAGVYEGRVGGNQTWHVEVGTIW